jgi:hypothetical protein
MKGTLLSSPVKIDSQGDSRAKFIFPHCFEALRCVLFAFVFKLYHFLNNQTIFGRCKLALYKGYGQKLHGVLEHKLVEQQLLTLPEHMGSSLVFSGVRVT